MIAIPPRLAFVSFCLPLVFFILQRASTAQEVPRDPAEWVTRGAEVANIQQAGTRPFKLHAKVKILVGKEQMYEGTFDLVWAIRRQKSGACS